MNKFEPKLRWPGAPPTCAATGMLAFDSEREVSEFNHSQCPHYTVTRNWKCPKCSKLHFDATLSGDDARNSRGKPPAGLPFLGDRTAKVKTSRSSASSQDLLSKQPPKEKAPAKPLRWPKEQKKEAELW